MNGAARFYAVAQLRASWRRRLALVLLLGVVGTVAIGAAAGAARTSTAVDRFVTGQRAFDLLVFCGPPEQVSEGFACEQDLRGLDVVQDTTAVLELPGMPSVGGENVEDVCNDAPGDVKLVVSPDVGFGSAINQHRFIAGRAADPSRADEVVIGRELAERLDLRVGDAIDFSLFAGAGCDGDPDDWRPPIPFTVVGVEVSPFEVRPEAGEYRAFIHATPALLGRVGALPDTELMVAVRLRDGVEVDDLRDPFDRLGISLQVFDVEGRMFAVPQSASSDNLQRSVRAHVTALGLLAVVTAAAGLILVGQMLNRQLRAAAGELRSLGHLGLTRPDLVAVGAVHLLSVVLPATLVAAVGAYLTSVFTPLGVARVLEVDRGVRLDTAVLGLGSLAMVVGLVGVAVPSLRVATRQRMGDAEPSAGRVGALARRLGGGPVSTIGFRMAFEPLRGPAAPPLRTGFGVILTAVVLLVGATVFAGSLNHLRASEHLIGWNWDAMLSPDVGDREPVSDARLRAAVAATPGVLATSSGSLFSPVLVLFGADEVYTSAVTFVGGPVGPTLISGRAPAGATEVVLGRETLAQLGYREGDQVPFVASTAPGDGLPPREIRGELTIVGTAVLPVVGSSRLGTGAGIDLELARSLVPEVQAGGVFVRYEPGAHPEEVKAAIADRLRVGGVDSIEVDTFGLDLILGDVEQMRFLPVAFAAALALLAVGVVGQVVVGSTHARREELGVLRALGLRPRQIRTAIVVQAVAVVSSVLIVGIPLGIALGRGAWEAFALSLGTKPEVSLAVGWLAALSVGLVVLACALGLLVSEGPRRRLAEALRSE